MIDLKATVWRDLPAGDELDWVIAQLLGWEARYKGHPTSLETAVYKGLLPNETALQIHRRYATGDETIVAGFLAHYSSDLDVIARLLLRNGMHFHICPPDEKYKYTALVTKGHDADASYGSSSADDPALALCRAWLGWKEITNT